MALAFALQFTGCSPIAIESAYSSSRGHDFSQSVKNYPELAEVAATFDQVVTPPPSPGERERQLDLLADVFEITRRDYVDEAPAQKLVANALAGLEDARDDNIRPDARAPAPLMAAALHRMISGLDAHSDYLTPDGYQEIQVRTHGEFGGIGIEVTMDNGLVKCISPIDDTPAARAGIRAGDLITRVDGESVLGKTLIQAVERMRGPPGTNLIVTVQRDGAPAPFDVTMTREIIRIQSVRAHAEGNIGYVRITTFNERTSDALHRAVADLHAKLGARMAGLVLDLRNNPGGLLDQALKVSDAFLSKGDIVSTASRHHRQVRRFTADREDIAEGLPVVALINGGSASASEIVAGALQDHGRALIMGTRSFGKGSVQTVIPLDGDGALRLTTARYYTPSGRSIQVRGIEPDIVATETHPGPREADLENPLAAEGQMVAARTDRIEEVCPAQMGTEKPLLACALSLFNDGSRSADASLAR